MNPSRILLAMAAVAGGLVLSSCSMMKSVTAKASKVGEKVGANAGELASDFDTPKFAGLFKRRPDVVEVREKDLKEMPLGEERALAYQKSRRSFWDIFRGPVDFKEPELPDDDVLVNGSLLPPKAE